MREGVVNSKSIVEWEAAAREIMLLLLLRTDLLRKTMRRSERAPPSWKPQPTPNSEIAEGADQPPPSCLATTRPVPATQLHPIPTCRALGVVIHFQAVQQRTTALRRFSLEHFRLLRNPTLQNHRILLTTCTESRTHESVLGGRGWSREAVTLAVLRMANPAAPLRM